MRRRSLRFPIRVLWSAATTESPLWIAAASNCGPRPRQLDAAAMDSGDSIVAALHNGVAGRLLPGTCMHGLDRTVERFCDAWNRHDVEALTALWAEDGELNHPWGARSVGRRAVRDALATEHTGSMADSTLTVRSIDARGDEHTLIADVDGVLTGVRAPNGRAYDLEHRMTAMFVRSGEEWQIRTMSPIANPHR